MNLPYVYDLLTAANEQRYGFITLRGLQAEHEVRLMADAGLVEASFDDGKEGSFTAIKRISAAGKTFLRAFKNRPIPNEAAVEESFAAAHGHALIHGRV